MCLFVVKIKNATVVAGIQVAGFSLSEGSGSERRGFIREQPREAKPRHS